MKGTSPPTWARGGGAGLSRQAALARMGRGGEGLPAFALEQDGTRLQANLGSPLHLACLLCSPLKSPTGPRATHSFVIGLLLLELLHHDAPLLVLAPLVLKPDPDHAGAEARHLHQLLLHEGVWPGVGGIAGPQGVELLLVQHSPNAGGLLGLLVDMGPQGRLPGGDGLGCEARAAVSAGQAARPPVLLPDNGQCFAASTDKAGAAEMGTREAKGRIISGSLI